MGGSRTTDDLAFHPAFWSAGVATDLGTLGGGSGGTAVGINNVGQAVGGSIPGGGLEAHATLWAGGGMMDLGQPGGPFSYAYGINDAGQIVGRANITDARGTYSRTVLWNSGVVTVLSNDTGSRPFGINAQGQVVGMSNPVRPTRATLWSDGSVTLLDNLPSGTFGAAYGINNAGQVVGRSGTAGNAASHAALWSGGVVTDLGTLGGTNSFAYAINNFGQVVGQSQTAAGATYHATLWSGGVATDLNDFLSLADRDAGWVLGDGTQFGAVEIGINDNGWIIAGAENTVTGSHRAYLLTPVASVPEPAGWALMLGGLAVVAAMRRRQRRRAD